MRFGLLVLFLFPSGTGKSHGRYERCCHRAAHPILSGGYRKSGSHQQAVYQCAFEVVNTHLALPRIGHTEADAGAGIEGIGKLPFNLVRSRVLRVFVGNAGKGEFDCGIGQAGAGIIHSLNVVSVGSGLINWHVNWG